MLTVAAGVPLVCALDHRVKWVGVVGVNLVGVCEGCPDVWLWDRQEGEFERVGDQLLRVLVRWFQDNRYV